MRMSLVLPHDFITQTFKKTMVPEGTVDIMFSQFFIDKSYQIMEEVALSFLNSFWKELQQICKIIIIIKKTKT